MARRVRHPPPYWAIRCSGSRWWGSSSSSTSTCRPRARSRAERHDRDRRHHTRSCVRREFDGCRRRVRKRHVAVRAGHAPGPLDRVRRGARRRVSRPAEAPRIEGTPADRAILALRPVLVLLPLFAYMLSSDNNIRYLIGYYQPAMIAQHARRANVAQAYRRPDTGHADRRHRRTDHVVADEAVAVVVLVRPGDGAVLALLRDAHLRQRPRRADSELLPVELRPNDACVHRFPGRPDAGFHGRRSQHEVLRSASSTTCSSRQ